MVVAARAPVLGTPTLSVIVVACVALLVRRARTRMTAPARTGTRVLVTGLVVVDTTVDTVPAQAFVASFHAPLQLSKTTLVLVDDVNVYAADTSDTVPVFTIDTYWVVPFAVPAGAVTV